MRTKTCLWCRQPYKGKLIAGSDGICNMKRIFKAIRRFWSKRIDLEIAYWNRKPEGR